MHPNFSTNNTKTRLNDIFLSFTCRRLGFLGILSLIFDILFRGFWVILCVFILFYSSKVESFILSTKKNIDKKLNFIDKVHYLTFLNRKRLQK